MGLFDGDSLLIADTLRSLDFEVIEKTNLEYQSFRRAVGEFTLNCLKYAGRSDCKRALLVTGKGDLVDI